MDDQHGLTWHKALLCALLGQRTPQHSNRICNTEDLHRVEDHFHKITLLRSSVTALSSHGKKVPLREPSGRVHVLPI